ncbi:hypothetical protein ACLB2K_065914 [Fragaria x ananassa]
MAHSAHKPPSPTVDEDPSASISAVHPDIIQAHILTRLDGPTLASAACTSSQLHSLASDHRLWSNICHSTWPSTTTPRLRHLISSFPDGAFSFFSDSFPLLANLDSSSAAAAADHHDRPSELISAVDIYHGEKLIFSKVVETETVSGWFMFSPFRVDLLDPKDVVPTTVKYPEADTCRDLGEELWLSWILIDPAGRRAMNLSSHTVVSVQRHWLSGEVHARFASIFPGEKGSASEYVQLGIVVTCGIGSEGGELQVREVSLQVEDMDGMHLNGKESLVILQRGLEGRKGRKGRRKEEGRRRYEKYLERKRERKEKKMRTEGTLDTLCVTFGVLGFLLFWLFILCR